MLTTDGICLGVVPIVLVLEYTVIIMLRNEKPNNVL